MKIMFAALITSAMLLTAGTATAGCGYINVDVINKTAYDFTVLSSDTNTNNYRWCDGPVNIPSGVGKRAFGNCSKSGLATGANGTVTYKIGDFDPQQSFTISWDMCYMESTCGPTITAGASSSSFKAQITSRSCDTFDFWSGCWKQQYCGVQVTVTKP